MRPFLMTFLFALSLSLAPLPAAAANQDGMTGQELLRLCSSKYDTEYGFCAGYISGIANTMLAGDVAGLRICSMGAARTQQLIDIYRSYAEVFPENLRGSAVRNVAMSLARSFPCRDQAPLTFE